MTPGKESYICSCGKAVSVDGYELPNTGIAHPDHSAFAGWRHRHGFDARAIDWWPYVLHYPPVIRQILVHDDQLRAVGLLPGKARQPVFTSDLMGQRERLWGAPGAEPGPEPAAPVEAPRDPQQIAGRWDGGADVAAADRDVRKLWT